ncbi:nickel-dependent lactate racemase [Nakamurella leprariae]|uniref:Nickel-dependent lactate racemase n=1 Tax=Nakamurella leprariae TaxID=2803911 RepID=A0A938YE32_9ACTN|nr:nickel-dependent lactate racemase [Nakamurella leprariae]MBM9468139.1 nickel-dependent lactate racemase [Nakamurella leprariae]
MTLDEKDDRLMPHTRSVELAYGDDGLVVELPADRTTVVEPVFVEGAPDPMAELRRALREPVAGPPLRERLRARGGRPTVAISMCDATRPQPRDLMIPALLEEFDGLVDLDDVVVLVATGTHRGNTEAELRAMLPAEVLDAVRVVNHDARDPSTLTWMGEHGDGVPVWLNAEWAAADIRITTGFVEPHFFAGFSGGPKLVAPGLAALETVLTLHDARRIGHPDARWGVCVGNPVHDDVRAIAAATGVDYSLDVLLNRGKQVIAAFGGDLLPMHEQARERSRELSMRPVEAPFDVTVTTNSGFPLDQNLYQAVKGMSAAATVTRPGGAIVCAAECRDGFPDHGSYREVLSSAPSPAALLAEIEARSETIPDQWQVQMQAKVQVHARVGVHSAFLGDDDLRSAHLEPVPDIADWVGRALDDAGPDARVCVLPEGPQTIPYVTG